MLYIHDYYLDTTTRLTSNVGGNSERGMRSAVKIYKQRNLSVSNVIRTRYGMSKMNRTRVLGFKDGFRVTG